MRQETIIFVCICEFGLGDGWVHVFYNLSDQCVYVTAQNRTMNMLKLQRKLIRLVQVCASCINQVEYIGITYALHIPIVNVHFAQDSR